MEFVTKENDETTIGFIHLQWNSEDTSIALASTALAEFPIISHLTYNLLPVQIVPRFVLFFLLCLYPRCSTASV